MEDSWGSSTLRTKMRMASRRRGAEALATLARERAAASPRGVDDIAVVVLVFNC